MQLPGRLEATTLGDLLGALYRARATGVLELVERTGVNAGRAHRVHLSGGLVGDVETPMGVARIGEILRREGFIDEIGLRRLLRKLAESPARRAGELLVAECGVTTAAVGAALRYQLRARLDKLFSLADVAIRFHVARSYRDAVTVPLSPREFLHGRPRARAVAERAPARRHDPVRSRALSVLGLGPAADRDSVQRAFRALARDAHPDRFPRATPSERAELMRRFAEISAAYHSLVA